MLLGFSLGLCVEGLQPLFLGLGCMCLVRGPSRIIFWDLVRDVR